MALHFTVLELWPLVQVRQCRGPAGAATGQQQPTWWREGGAAPAALLPLSGGRQFEAGRRTSACLHAGLQRSSSIQCVLCLCQHEAGKSSMHAMHAPPHRASWVVGAGGTAGAWAERHWSGGGDQLLSSSAHSGGHCLCMPAKSFAGLLRCWKHQVRG